MNLKIAHFTIPVGCMECFDVFQLRGFVLIVDWKLLAEKS